MRPFYRPGHYGMDNSVGYLIRRTANLVLPQMETVFAEEDLTFSQWTVLMALREWKQSTSAELARNICHDAGSLTRVLDQLETRGLMTRLRSETDRRVVTLTLTPKGLAFVEDLIPRVVEYWNGLLGDFDHAEIKVLIKLLTRLVGAAETGRAPRRSVRDSAKAHNKPEGASRVTARRRGKAR